MKKEKCKKSVSVFIVLVMLINLILVTPVKAYGETLGSGFNSPEGVAVDSSWNVYVADVGNNAVKRMDSNGGHITTLGSGFNSPEGVAVDSSGNVYVADMANNAVKRMDSNGGHITTLGSGFSSPEGVAVDGSGNIYVADTGNSEVKKMDSNGCHIETLGSGFSSPAGVAVDSSGNVYVADTANNAIKRMDSSGGSTTTLGFGFSYPNGVAVDSSGNIYVADTANSEVKKMDSNGGHIETLGSGFSYTRKVTVDSSGNVYVTDSGNNAVKKLSVPKITSVTVPAAKVYKAGDTLNFTVNFYSAVTEVSNGGTPGLSLRIGGASETAAYVSGSGTSTLNFSYTVQAGDIDTDGIVVNGISLNGGTISSSDNVYANLTLNSVGSTIGVLVNGVIPTFTGNTTTLTVDANSGATDVSGLFYVSDTAAGHTLTWSISSGPSHGTAAISSATAASGGSDIAPGTITYSPSNGYCGTDSFTIEVSDEDGNKETKTVNVSVACPPAVSAASASSISTTSVSLNGTVNADYYDTTVTFEYGTSASYGNTIAASGGTVTGVSNTAVSAVASGLLPATTYHYRVKAQNNYGTAYSSDKTFTTSALPQIQTADPTGATVGNAYSYTFTSTGGNGGNNYSVTSESLPAGLSLSSDGILSGTPTVHGTYSFEITVTDSLGKQSSNTFTLNVGQHFALDYSAEPHGSIQGSTAQTVSYGSGGTSVTAVPDIGYHFAGWNDGVSTAARTDTNIAGNINVIAEFAINTYTVTFKDWDGTVIGTPQTVDYGAGAAAPANPLRTGYSFAGWDKAFDNITGDLTVTAKYISGNTYTFTASQNTDEAAMPEGYFDSGDNTLIVNNNGVTFTIPAGAVDITGLSNTDNIRTTEKTVEGSDKTVLIGNLPDGMQLVGSPLGFDLRLYNNQSILIREIHQFANNQKVKVSIKLTGDELKNLDTGKLSAYYYDENSKQWIELGGSFDSSTGAFTFNTTHFTKFAIMEKVSAGSKTMSNANSTANISVSTTGKLVQTGSLFDFNILICLGGILILAGVIQIRLYSMKKSKKN